MPLFVDTIEETYQAHLTALNNLASAILTLTETGGTVTTDGTEQDIYLNNAPAALYSPRILKLDFTAHTAGETVVVRVYYRVESGGGLIKQIESTYAGAQDPELVNIDLEDNRYGVQITIEKTGGANRAYDWEVVYKV